MVIKVQSLAPLLSSATRMTCTKCDKKKTFVHPEDFCDEHWARWWVSGILKDSNPTLEEYETELAHTLDVIHGKYPEQGDNES